MNNENAVDAVGSQRERVSYLRSDLVALVFGLVLTAYALFWFGKETLERIEHERSVVPASVRAPQR